MKQIFFKWIDELDKLVWETHKRNLVTTYDYMYQYFILKFYVEFSRYIEKIWILRDDNICLVPLCSGCDLLRGRFSPRLPRAVVPLYTQTDELRAGVRYGGISCISI